MRGDGAPGPELDDRTGGGSACAQPRPQAARRPGGCRWRAARTAGARALLAAGVGAGVLAGVLAGVVGSPVAALAAPAATTAPGAGLTAPATAAAAPAATVGRSGSFLTDDQHRAVVIRGMSVPAGVTPNAAVLDTWIGYGFTGVRLAVPVATGGHFPAVAGWPAPDAGAGDEPGLAQAVGLTRLFTARGLRVTLRLVPVASARTSSGLSTATLTAGLARLAARFRDEPGLLGYEAPATPGTGTVQGDGAELLGAVAAQDTHHLLWRERPAPFDAAARVAVNDPTGYLIGWKDGTPATLTGLAAAADTFGLSWFYDPPGAAGGTLPAAPAQLVRPYPEAIAGTPEALRLDAAGVLTVVYRPVSPTGTALAASTPTAISLPAWSYPNGYQVRVSGARVTSAPGAGVLCVVAQPGAARVQVQVSPAVGGGSPVTPPHDAGAAGCAASAHGAAVGAGPGGDGGLGAGGGIQGRDDADGGDDAYSGPLLWLLPLIGAAGAAALLAAVLRPWRRRGGLGQGGPGPAAGPGVLTAGTARDPSAGRAGD
ncbi:conserved hypothetical protein [Frankia canadensis]|uniref:Glycoside hydrolase family 5 C-terminal domain-containing protein n=1 Tax=Frankia canadensis TaxID=1836972 RepID=A0A2I2KM72_9ACTN|nr:hypothetical protein [Frankia canadensis]SNQ46760.1 conserved hypothetical protein [Frankia canadensis]SOU54050.1 conserved hypothetical protein [Frankia canadensis]